MSEKWEDFINDAERVQWLMEHIMGWECHGSWEAYHRKYAAQEYALGDGVSYTTPTSVAFCYPGVHYTFSNPRDKPEWRVFSPDHENLDVFDPLHNLNDTKKLIVKIIQPPISKAGIPFIKWWMHAEFLGKTEDEIAEAACRKIYEIWQGTEQRVEQ